MKDTAFSEAFKAKGVLARDVELELALAKYRNNGGTYDVALAMLNAAFANADARYSAAGRTLSELAVAARKGSADHRGSADKAAEGMSAASPTDAAEGQDTSADDKAIGRMPDAAPERSAGQTTRADKASPQLPVASSRRSRADRLASGSSAAVEQVYRKSSLFDTYRLPGDYRPIGDVSCKELLGLARKLAEGSRLASLLAGYGQSTDPDAKVRDVFREDTLREFIEIARLRNVH